MREYCDCQGYLMLDVSTNRTCGDFVIIDIFG